MNDDAENRGDRASRDVGMEEEPLDGGDVIDLTEAAEADFGDSKTEGILDDGDDVISLDEAALEEDDIVELVDVAEEELGETEEEPLDLSDLVEEELSEGDGDDPSSPSESVFSDDDSGDTEFAVDVSDDLGDTSVDMSELSGDPDDSPVTLDLEEDVMESSLELDLSPDQSGETMKETASDEALVAERLSDEKLEAIVTRVVKETVEEKAGQILLEVAEAAIAKEIEKIKKTL